MTKSRPLVSHTRLAAPTHWRSKSSPEGLQVESRDLTSTQKGGSETKCPTDSLAQTNVPPKTFQDILPPQLITTSTLSEAGYMGYRKSKFKTTRASTFPVPHASQTVKHVVLNPIERTVYPPATTARRSTLKKMKGVMHSIKRSISTLNDPKKKIRPPIPSSSAFAARTSRGRFGIQDGGYLNLSDGEVAVGDDSN